MVNHHFSPPFGEYMFFLSNHQTVANLRISNIVTEVGRVDQFSSVQKIQLSGYFFFADMCFLMVFSPVKKKNVEKSQFWNSKKNGLVWWVQRIFRISSIG